jgi:hypothetical protein
MGNGNSAGHSPKLSARDIAAGLAIGHAVSQQHHHHSGGNVEISVAAAYWASVTTSRELAEGDDDAPSEYPDHE